eukprot:15474599-Alexandrium_andersonii.AAC.1
MPSRCPVVHPGSPAPAVGRECCLGPGWWRRQRLARRRGSRHQVTYLLSSWRRGGHPALLPMLRHDPECFQMHPRPTLEG